MKSEIRQQLSQIVHDIRGQLSTASMGAQLIKNNVNNPAMVKLLNEKTLNAIHKVDDLMYKASEIVDTIPIDDPDPEPKSA